MRLHPQTGMVMRRDPYIPGQEYEFATVEQIDDRIRHLEFLMGKTGYGPYLGPGAEDLPVEYDMLRFQWRGNALVRAREFAGEVTPQCSCVWCNPSSAPTPEENV